MMSTLLSRLRRLMRRKGGQAQREELPSIFALVASSPALSAAVEAADAIERARQSSLSEWDERSDDVFAIGDVVRLKWGGAEMEVTGFCESKVGATIVCSWYGCGKRQSGPFVADAIELVKRKGYGNE